MSERGDQFDSPEDESAEEHEPTQEVPEPYRGPDPEAEPAGDSSDEDQGT